MNMDLTVSQQLTQTLSTELIKQLEILQFSEEELRNYIYEKSIENPLINLFDHEMKLLKDVVNLSTSEFSDFFNKSSDETISFIHSNITQQEPSEKYLLEQIPLLHNLTDLDRKILKYLIYHLDNYYFLKIETNEIIERFKVEESYVENLIQLLQTFEPVGVGARDFTEYLLIKIENDSSAPALAKSFVQENLQLVANYSIKQLSKIYKISTKQVKEVVDYIRNIELPTSRSNNISEEYIIPDVEVKKVYGEWVIEIFNPYRPKIELNEEYVELLKNNIDCKDFYKEHLKDYMLLTQGIKRRDQTIYSITRLLLKLQPAFFESGISALEPLKIKDLAKMLDIHESTVSRAIRNKYIRTPHGIFAFRSLFSKGIANATGKTDSVQHIKKRIQELIDNEDKSSPYSDQQLANLLISEGIKISRRTVTKYREDLRILNSNKRLYI